MSDTKLPRLNVAYQIELTPEMLLKFEQCVKEALPEIVMKCLGEMDLEKIIEEKVRLVCAPEDTEIELRTATKEEATIKIMDYIKEHPNCKTSDIICDLALEPDLVLTVLNELRERNMIKGIPIE